MKTKLLFFLILFLSSFLSRSQTAFEENFENKTNGFNLTSDGYVLTKNSNYTGTVTAVVNENGGNKYARMNADVNASAGMQITKSITVEAGKTYIFEIESKGPFMRQLRVYDLNNVLLASSSDYKPDTTPEQNAWYKQEVSFYVSSGTTSVKIAFHHYWSGTIDLDNLKVFEIERQSEYYLSNSGDDNNEGTIASPWATLNKISNTSLFPGDKVYFNRGDRFDGHFVVNGSGEENNPIVITSYGNGVQPIISGEVGAASGGDYKEAILIENNDNITIEDIEVRNDRTATRSGVNDTDSFGISIHNGSEAVMKNFIFRNITVKNVFAVEPVLDRDSFDAIQVSGIRFTCSRNIEVGKEKNIQNILIEDSYFTNLQRLGIQFKHNGGNAGIGDDQINRNKDIIVRNNEFYYNGGTAVLPNATYNCLIENNIFDHPGASTDPRMPARGSSVWNINCINTVVQYNMCLSTRGYLDSYGIHIDLNNENTFVQYNYMEDCEGGFVEILAGNKNAVYRFNVDVNSGFRVSDWNNASSTIYVYSDRWKEPNQAALNLPDGIYINNNTIIIDKGTKTNGDPYTTSITSDAKNTYVYNNIFSSTNGAVMGARNFAIRDNGTTFLSTNNLFEGTVLNDWVEMDINPQIGSSYFSETGDDKLAYQVTENSPALNNGTTIEGPILPGAGSGVFENVPAYPNVDFYGNPIDLSTGTPNIGAYNGKSNAALLSTNTFESENQFKFIVFPNEEKTELYVLDTSNKLSENTEISLCNIRGQIIVQKEFSTSNDSFILDLPLAISNGIYILNINTGNISRSRKIVLHK